MKKPYNYISMVLIFFVSACSTAEKDGSSSTQENGENRLATDSTVLEVMTEEISRFGTFEFEQKEGEYGPISTIKVASEGELYPVGEIMGAVSLMAEIDFEDMGIPTSALSACGAWWAGGGDYFYLVQEGPDLVIMTGWIEEGTDIDEGYHWEEMLRIR